jgi:hypothetical protein
VILKSAVLPSSVTEAPSPSDPFTELFSVPGPSDLSIAVLRVVTQKYVTHLIQQNINHWTKSYSLSVSTGMGYLGNMLCISTDRVTSGVD